MLDAEFYYAKQEPLKIKNIASNVTGEVLFINESMLGKRLGKKPFMVIDSSIDKAELKSVKEKQQAYKKMLHYSQENLKNLQNVLKKKRLNYKKTQALKIKSRIDKDREFYDLINSENALLATQKEIETIKNTLSDLVLKEKRLKKKLRDKSIVADGYLLYSIDVKEGSVVNITTPIAKVADVSKGILRFYVDADELEGIWQKSVYLNGKKTSYKVQRVIPVADSVNISKYQVEVITDAPKIFSQLIKIELKKER
jgi:hypothetical protein